MRAILSLVLTLAIGVPACGSGEATDDSISIVASFYPLAYAAQRVGGEAVTVTNLTPPGVEPHDLELTPEAVEQIASADVVVYISGGFQPAVEESVDAEATGVVVDAAGASSGGPGASTDHDPHIWLDPSLYAGMVERVTTALAEVRAPDDETFSANARRLEADLDELAESFRLGLAECATRTMITNHAAFGYLAAAYDLDQQAIAGSSPESEPDPQRIAELAELADLTAATTVFAEDLLGSEAAETLAAEADLEIAVLSPLEGLTEAQIAAGDDFLSVMRRNLETLRDGLVCA
jgi:zinc transport system substrate-binding protein